MYILIVDDERRLRKEIYNFLTQKGHQCDQASNGGSALDLLDTKKYDAVISDVQMPGRFNDGISLLQGAWRTLKEHVPFCVHSSEDTFFFYDNTWNLPIDIPRVFSFAEFHNKKKEDWKKYIPEFLGKIQT